MTNRRWVREGYRPPSVIPGRQPNCWWNEDIAEARAVFRKARRACKKAKGRPTEKQLEDFKNARKEMRRLIEESKLTKLKERLEWLSKRKLVRRPPTSSSSSSSAAAAAAVAEDSGPHEGELSVDASVVAYAHSSQPQSLQRADAACSGSSQPLNVDGEIAEIEDEYEDDGEHFWDKLE